VLLSDQSGSPSRAVGGGRRWGGTPPLPTAHMHGRARVRPQGGFPPDSQRFACFCRLSFGGGGASRFKRAADLDPWLFVRATTMLMKYCRHSPAQSSAPTRRRPEPARRLAGDEALRRLRARVLRLRHRVQPGASLGQRGEHQERARPLASDREDAELLCAQGHGPPVLGCHLRAPHVRASARAKRACERSERASEASTKDVP
jgi:hypothetical protein